jgi:outer membrane protein OmpA-like peptidoglycan-associated protein
MKRFIPSAFATLAMPFLAIAQSPVPASDEVEPQAPQAAVPAPETGVPSPPPVVPTVAPADQAPAAVPAVPGRREAPGTPGRLDRPERSGPPGTNRRPAESERPDTPGRSDATRPGPGVPKAPARSPSDAAPKGDPSANPKRSAPPRPSREMPSARPDETPDTPPATRGTPSARPSSPGTRPMPGKRPANPQERGVEPSVPPTAPVPGAPMPAEAAKPEAPSEPKSAGRPKGSERPGRSEGRGRPERPAAQKPPSQETAQILEDEPKRDRQADAAQARKIENPEDAKRLLLNILGGGAARADSDDRRGSNDRSDPRRRRDGSRSSYRPSFEEVGRTQQDRDRAVSSIVERFQGRPPQAAPSGGVYREQRIFESNDTRRRTRFYDGNRRVIRYSSRQEIPPIIIASQQLNRVQLLPHAQSSYRVMPPAPQQQERYYQNDIPPSYTTGDAYAVSYSVDPESAISTDAILFRQGSTDFADAYSYDLVIDMANAMKSPALSNDTFVIEGHASAEGDYGQNLQLSQERAERISRELVYHGVSAERLMPVGYGEAEAASPADANEADRRLDRRVVVFRMR